MSTCGTGQSLSRLIVYSNRPLVSCIFTRFGLLLRYYRIPYVFSRYVGQE